jgi:hypothetical protein
MLLAQANGDSIKRDLRSSVKGGHDRVTSWPVARELSTQAMSASGQKRTLVWRLQD